MRKGGRAIRRRVGAALLAGAITAAALVGAGESASAARSGTQAAPAAAPKSAPETALETASKAVDCARVKCIALTFDDGPSASTAKLLDTLKRHRAKATFFLVGRQVEKRPGVARRMAREGHEIGNHTYSHARLTELSEQEILAEVTDAQQAIRAATGREPALMRPPFGAVDERVQAVAEFAGLPVVMWTGSTRDWELKDTRKIAAKALGLARRDAVILMHDIVPQTVAAMPKILTELRERGYHVVTVSSVLRGRELAPGQRYP